MSGITLLPTLMINSSISANSTSLVGSSFGGASDIATNAINGGSHPAPSLTNVLQGTVPLGAFTNAGGFLGVLVPPSGSAAINAVPCGTNAIDERGMARPDPPSTSLATPCDIGAVEYSIADDTIFKNGFEP